MAHGDTCAANTVSNGTLKAGLLGVRPINMLLMPVTYQRKESTNERRSSLSYLRMLFVDEVLKCCLLGKMAVGAYLHALLELGNDFGEILQAVSPVDSLGG